MNTGTPDTAPEATSTRRFFLGTGLPVFLLAAALVYEAFLAALVFAPESAGWWGAFAREFRVWCFSYDPRTGGMEWSAVGLMAVEPLFIVAVTLLLWRRALRTQSWLASWRSAVAGATVATLAAGILLTLGAAAADETPPPFPGERIRTHLTAPPFALKDQTGRECQLPELRGRVVLVTGIYAACTTTCPQILRDTRQLLDSLPPEARAQVSVVAFSLNPEYETTELMAAVAGAYGFQHPEFRYLNGEPRVMHRLLEDFQFARLRNPKTGAIDHANLMILVDAHGTIAYRFNLNPKHQAWLRAAVLALAAEAADVTRAVIAGQ